MSVVRRSMRQRNSVMIVTFIFLCILMIIIHSPDISLVQSIEFRASGFSFPNDSLNTNQSDRHGQELPSSERFDNLDPAKAIEILNKKRSEIAEEVKDFEAVNETFELSKFTPESNGIPIRNVILSTKNSGSAFLGEIFNTMPGNYHFHEPLRHLGDIQIREQNRLLRQSIQTLHQILKCNFTGQDQYMEQVTLDYNIGLSKFCGTLIPLKLCKTYASFLNAFCSIFPIQTMTEVRLRPAFVEPLLMDSDLNVRVLLLIRDPRGIIASRKLEEWCSEGHECGDYAKLCQDLVLDFKATQYLTKKYPKRFKAIRHEDLSLNPFKVTKEVLEFYGLPFHKNVKQFLISHPLDVEHSMLRFLNSKDTAFSWRKSLNFSEIVQIQEQCTDALNLWGYQKMNYGDLKSDTNNGTFYPLLQYPFNTEYDET